MGLGELFGKIGIGGGSGNSFITNSLSIIVGSLVLIACAVGVWWFFKKRRQYNFKVEVKIPRNIKEIKYKNGTLRVIGTLNKEWAKDFIMLNKGLFILKENIKNLLQ